MLHFATFFLLACFFFFWVGLAQPGMSSEGASRSWKACWWVVGCDDTYGGVGRVLQGLLGVMLSLVFILLAALRCCASLTLLLRIAVGGTWWKFG